MSVLRISYLVPAVVGLVLGGGGCKEPDCLDDVDLVAGCGARVGDVEIHLGDALTDLEAALGSADRTRDLDPLGTWFAYDAQTLSGYHATVDGAAVVTALELGESFAGTTAGGVGIGASADAVAGEFGTAAADPFLGTRYFPAAGIAFEFSDGTVARIHVVATEP